MVLHRSCPSCVIGVIDVGADGRGANGGNKGLQVGKLDQKVVVITGGNSGMGLAMAQEFSRQGAKVVIFGRDQETLSEAAASLAGEGMAVKGDVRAVDDLEALFAKVKARFGAIDIVVANAGGASIEPFLEVSEESFDTQSDINFKGVFFTVQKAVPLMNDGGAVIIVSSSANARAVAGMSVYGAAKAAVRSLARMLTLELAPRKIHVNVLTPGPVQTPAYSRTGLSAEEIAVFQQEQALQIPLGRIGKAHEMATAALFLASNDAAYVAGAELVAEGGMTQV